MHEHLKIAVKIPTYNAERTVGETIKSLLSQSYKYFEIYVYDNCSTDNTLNIVKSFNDPRVHVVESTKNNGWKWNFDRCLKYEGCSLTLFAHADDIYHSEFLDRNLAAVNKFDNVGLFFSKGEIFYSQKKISKKINKKVNSSLSIKKYETYEDILEELALNGNFIFCPSAFGRSEIFSDVIREFNESEFRGSADLDAWLRVVKNNTAIAIINSPTIFYYRVSEMQISEIERGIDESVFVKCMNAHLQSINEKNRMWKKRMTNLIRWHEIFHILISDLKKYVAAGSEKSFNDINFNLNELLRLKYMHRKRVAKHLLFMSVIFSTFIFPKKIRKLLLLKLVKLAR
jgi:glycosyltransferase involved in cell wall biosynthesis